jgi:pyruvate dehydrogenase complex dehydrogenase (E1) component
MPRRAKGPSRGDGLHPHVRRPDPPFVPGRYVALGTDGFGRSDYRVKLRSFFEVDRTTSRRGAEGARRRGAIEPSVVAEAIERYELDTEPVPPWKR